MTMNFNEERENNIIKNIAKEVVVEGSQRGLDATEELANYLVKIKLLDPKNGFTASEVMPRSLTQQLVHLIFEDLKQDTPAMNCIRMQVQWDMFKLNGADLRKEYELIMAERGENYLSEALSLDKEDSSKLPKLIAAYLILAHNLGNILQAVQFKETVAAVHSIVRNKDANYFFSSSTDDKIEFIKNISKKVTGIRLYLKHIGKAGEGIEDVKKLVALIEDRKDYIVAENKKILKRIDELEEALLTVVSLDYFAMDLYQTADIYMPPDTDMNDLIYAKKILTIMLQHNFYISDVLSFLDEIDGNAQCVLTEYDHIMHRLHLIIKDREAVPTVEVYDEFHKIGELWLEVQVFLNCLDVVEEIMETLGSINKKEYFQPTVLERAIGLPQKTAYENKSFESMKSAIPSSVLLMDEIDDITVEFNGFCAWTLYYGNGLLIPGNSQHKPRTVPLVKEFQGQYFLFSTKSALELWSRDPLTYLGEVYEYIRQNPELIKVLNAYDILHSNRDVVFKKVVERKVSNRPESTQTALHPIEKYWDPEYTFSIWELKKRALGLSRLVKCVTKSVQTPNPHSHFRASIGVLAAPDKDKEVQTKRDSYCVHPAIANYLYGLRGHRENKFKVIQLTRPIEESVKKRSPDCTEDNSQPKNKNGLQEPFFTEPCLSFTSEDKCDQCYSPTDFYWFNGEG